MVIRVERRHDRVDRVVTAIRTQNVQARADPGGNVASGRNQSGGGRRSRRNLVDVRNTDQVRALAADIADRYGRIGTDLPLDIQTPLLDVGRLVVRIPHTQARRRQTDDWRAGRWS